MARVNMTLPDDLLSQAGAGLKVLRLAPAALAEELDRRAERAAWPQPGLGPLRRSQGVFGAKAGDRAHHPGADRGGA